MTTKRNDETSKGSLFAQIERVLSDALRKRSVPGIDARQIEETAVRDVLGVLGVLSAIGDKDSAGTRSAASYLRLIRRMLEAIRSGISRNQFLADVFSEISNDTEIERAIIVIEGYPSPDGKRVQELGVPFVAGISDSRIDGFRNTIQEREESSFLIKLLLHRNSYDFDLRSILLTVEAEGSTVYRDELVELHGKNETWICALALPASELGEPERTLVALYPSTERSYSPSLPPGAKQEWDILRLIPDIFSMLQHRIRTFREKVAEDQRKLIAELAPRAITHELGTSLNLMESALGRTKEHFEGLRKSVGANNHLLELVRELSIVRNRIEHAKDTTDAFTNLERRNPRSRVDLLMLIDEVGTVLRQRLNLANITVRTFIPAGLEIVTDARFVEHVVMNVIMNAVEAVEPLVQLQRQRGEPPDGYMIVVAVQESGASIDLTIANNGPPIPIAIASRVFEKGITTKPHGVGHGQGLYLCRQIAQHLSGTFGFGQAPRGLSDANVAFRLSIPKVAPFESDT